MRAMQRTQFRAKSANNGLKPTYLINCNFYFETEGVSFCYPFLEPILTTYPLNIGV